MLVAAGAIGGLVAASTGISPVVAPLGRHARHDAVPRSRRHELAVLSCAALIAVVALMLFSVAPAVRVRFQ